MDLLYPIFLGKTEVQRGAVESPQAYKPIEQVIAVLADLMEIPGKFEPRIVRMSNEAGEYYVI